MERNSNLMKRFVKWVWNFHEFVLRLHCTVMLLHSCRASAHERLEPKGSVLNGSERTDGCFTTAFFQAQHASFFVRYGGRTAVGGGNGTRKNISACAHERQNNRTATNLRLPFQAFANILDVDFDVFHSERLISEGRKGRHSTID